MESSGLNREASQSCTSPELLRKSHMTQDLQIGSQLAARSAAGANARK